MFDIYTEYANKWMFDIYTEYANNPIINTKYKKPDSTTPYLTLSMTSE
jgi:hypothetical protein